MSFVKFLLFSAMATIIMFFVWNILKRIFFTKFYQYFPHQKEQKAPKDIPTKKRKKPKNGNLNWDAETVEYEEVKE